ncbi:uncharacterized protein A1O9_07334 [Exophiala aquamarina CBS 119918]|uniref:Uncharacterized protein n=1 Tax=Exophiala aquamarina CBS 119918 TaxID=1182545 RepID=A0A072PAK1_9EURO|nr:uncharacterized protein A1O9_07334 [Exophiala aquamarina CBS 119918]KEF57144.1 hypothetical protein A1O9_07334 [Exophiala aquamarina CBS 119918]
MQEDRITVKSEKIFTWLYKFGGESYMPNVTIVTTKWDRLDSYGIQDKLERIDKWKANSLNSRLTWSAAIFYHHGLVGVPGEFATLRIGVKDEERKSRALALIASRYGYPSGLALQIYDEVANHCNLEQTSAGQHLKHYGEFNRGSTLDSQDQGNVQFVSMTSYIHNIAAN